MTAAMLSLFHLAAQRAGGRGQHDGEADRAAVDGQIPNHVERDEIVVEFRLLDRAGACMTASWVTPALSLFRPNIKDRFSFFVFRKCHFGASISSSLAEFEAYKVAL
ncbi:MAG: hypothetical protein R2838_11860 [Caldilineaceae bacterium]